MLVSIFLTSNLATNPFQFGIRLKCIEVYPLNEDKLSPLWGKVKNGNRETSIYYVHKQKRVQYSESNSIFSHYLFVGLYF